MTVHRFLLVASAALTLAIAALGFATSASATTIDFEDADGKRPDIPLPDGYAGFSWSFFDGSQTNSIAPIDVPFIISPLAIGWYNGVGCAAIAGDLPGCNGAYGQRLNQGTNTPTAITRANDPFIFNRVDWTSTRGTQTLTVEGYSGGVLKFRDDHVDLTLNRRTFTFNWAGIDQVRIFQVEGANPWVMDNFTYGIPVPEPASMVYLLAGLGVLGVLARRRHRA